MIRRNSSPGSRRSRAADPGGVNLSGFMAQPAELAESPASADPGPVPEELLRIPGFVSEVMDYCLATAPYPNRVMAFCGALALQVKAVRHLPYTFWP